MTRKFTDKKLLLATNNKDKITEIKGYFEKFNLDFEVVTPAELGIEEPEETEETFQGNAELKARFYGRMSNLPSLADDTGVCVEALGGKPGVHTARWAGPNKDFKVGMDRIQKELKLLGFSDNLPAAYCVCVLSLYWPDNDTLVSFEGRIDGKLNFDFRDVKGFGFQPVFVPNGFTKSFGMMSDSEREQVGHHRITAFKKLLKSCF